MCYASDRHDPTGVDRYFESSSSFVVAKVKDPRLNNWPAGVQSLCKSAYCGFTFLLALWLHNLLDWIT